MDGDVPLHEAQVIWDYHGNDPDAPPLLVMGHPDANGLDLRGTRDVPDYYSSWGACLAEFIGATYDERLTMLFEKFQELVTFEGLTPAAVHSAFCAIPEYRYSLIGRGLGGHIPEDLRDEDEEREPVGRLRARSGANERNAIDGGNG